MRERQRIHFNSHHSARELSNLQSGQTAWIPDNRCTGTVLCKCGELSYMVQTGSGQRLRRNQQHLHFLKSGSVEDEEEEV